MSDHAAVHSVFQFFPRPEAKPMRWDQLLPPVRSAVRGLLVLLAGAERLSDDSDLEVASCFLVNGERGTGKTSVLINAREAFEKQERFFGDSGGKSKKEADDRGGASNTRKETPECGDYEEQDARVSAGDLKGRVVWLDILDLEPVHAETNLLTTVLTRIRYALCPRGCEDREQELRSLFEAGPDSAWSLLDRLIGDATLMWESIQENDTRSTANRQVAAADIYARFRDNFRKAMDKLAEELGRPYGRDERRSIILPIDNIDRSTEHLQAIVKLAQLVSHPRLWLVMAGGREDIGAFLERVYWKELIRIGGGSGALGRTEPGGEDETLIMARRQAAATAQKIWPSSHRIVVGRVGPEATLGFSPSGNQPRETIRQLLGKVSVPNWLKQSSEEGSKPFSIFLIDLFESRARPVDSSGGEGAYSLTQAARNALKLPARGVLEFWQLAHWAVHDETFFKDKEQRAEQIARTMLRNVISESMILNRLSRRLQDHVILNEVNGGTLLNFKDEELKVECVAAIDTELALLMRPEQARHPIQSRIRVKRGDDSFLRFKLKDKRGREEELPELVAAWLSILYDLLALTERLAILRGTRIQPPIMETHHAVIIADPGTGMRQIEKELRWPVPDWETFRAHDLFWQFWKSFQRDHEKEREAYEQEREKPLDNLYCELLPRFLAAGWIRCVLDTFLAMNRSREKSDVDPQDPRPALRWPLEEAQMEKYEVEVLSRAAALHAQLEECIRKPARSRRHFDSQAMLDWLVEQLPMFFSYWYVPTADTTESSHHFGKIITFLKGSENPDERRLAEKWLENIAFIVAAMDENLAKLFEPEPGAMEKGEKGDHEKEMRRQAHKEYLETLSGLCGLHRFHDFPGNT